MSDKTAIANTSKTGKTKFYALFYIFIMFGPVTSTIFQILEK